MLGHHEYKGLWWSPHEEEKKLGGTLSVNKGKAELEVIGDFGRELLSENPKEKSYSLNLADRPRIIGVSTDGKPITLEHLSERGHTMHFPGLPTSRYGAAVSLVGKHFSPEEEVAFDEIAIGASDLNTWTQVSGFATSLRTEPLDEEGHVALVRTDVSYEAPEDIHIPLARGEEIILRFTGRSEGLGGRSERVELRQEAALHWRFSKPADLASVFNRVGQIRNFLSLAVGRPVSVLSVIGYRDDYRRNETAFPRPIEIYWEIPHNPEPPTQVRRFDEMFFTFAEAKPEMSTVMNKWLRKQSRLEPVFNLFFGTLYHPNLYLEVKFLAYAQVIETYDYRRRRKHSDKHLAERMKDVLGKCRTVSKRIVGPDTDAFVVGFRNARNYYTHYSPRLEKKAAKGTALFLLSIQLQTILEMALLHELGFPCRAIDEILERANRYNQIEHFRSMISQKTDRKST